MSVLVDCSNTSYQTLDLESEACSLAPSSSSKALCRLFVSTSDRKMPSLHILRFRGIHKKTYYSSERILSPSTTATLDKFQTLFVNTQSNRQSRVYNIVGSHFKTVTVCAVFSTP